MKLHLTLALPLIALASCASDSGSRSTPEPVVPANTDEPMAMEVVPLQYAAAQELAGALGNLLYEGGPVPRATRIVADSRTNALIVRAPREELPRILDLIRRLDRKVE
jgi:type II secretory pathway component GspD/PulD (secretin)